MQDALVLDAREEPNDGHTEDANGWDDATRSGIWTFYILQTNKGAVVLRWLGESNGYYSESVSFRECEACPEEVAQMRAEELFRTTAQAHAGVRQTVRL